MNGTPMISHSGEVSGFLASNTVFPAKGMAVTVLSNEDGISLIGPLSRQISELLLSADTAKETTQVDAILEGLQHGRIDRAFFTSDANSYFTDTVLHDYASSLSPLGKLQGVTRTAEQLRGGMTHRSYRAQFETKTLLLNIYVMPDGKYEQFLVEDTLP